MKALGFTETVVLLYQTATHQIPQDGIASR
jgi:hypothetical protein